MKSAHLHVGHHLGVYVRYTAIASFQLVSHVSILSKPVFKYHLNSEIGAGLPGYAI